MGPKGEVPGGRVQVERPFGLDFVEISDREFSGEDRVGAEMPSAGGGA
jgi:hypothetical protein